MTLKTVIYDEAGIAASTLYGTLADTRALALTLIKARARTLIEALEGENKWRLERARERDELYGSYDYQAILHKKEIIRQRSDECEADVNGLGLPEEIADYNYGTVFDAPIDLSAIPVVMTNIGFQKHAAFILANSEVSPGIEEMGAALLDVRAKADTIGGMRGVMERFDKAATITKGDAAALLNILTQTGVSGFTATERDLILSEWPTLE